jgi:hypothetical protein
LSSPFSYSENLANLDDGLHSLRLYAYSKGVVEGCEWSPNTLIENYSLSDLVYFRLDTTAPVISVLSIENKTYYSPDVPLDFTLNEPVSQIEYSLDGNENISISGNTTLTELANRDHTLIIYARDSVGNLGKSKTIVFTIAEEPESEPFPTPLVVASIVTVTVIALGLLLYFKKTQALSRICLFTFTF